MIAYYDLEVGCQCLHDLEDEPKHCSNCSPIIIGQCINRSLEVCILITRIVDLRWLIEKQKPWHRPCLLAKVLMQSKVRDQMVANPVLASTHT